MPLFGKDETKDEVESVMMAVEDIKAHMNALDNAVQHHDQEIDQVVKALTSEEKVSEHIEENAGDIRSLKKVFRKFSSIQSNYIERVDVLDSELSKTDKNVSKIESKLTRLEKGQDALFEEVEDLKDKIEELESEFILDTNRQEWDIESKVSSSEFNEHKGDVERELSKLRTSLNDLSDKIEEENVEIEE